MDAGWLRDVNLLLWVHTGTAQVQMDGGQMHRLAAGDGIWLPAGGGGRVSTDAGSVAFPYRVPPKAAPAAPAAPVRFAVPDGWRDWLILHYVHGVAPITSFGYSRVALLDILGAPGATPKAPSSTGTPRAEPPLPTARGARNVAEQLWASPALDRSIAEWAALVACSVSTLRRGFLDTGLTFAQWRTLSRLVAACEFLAAGYDVERVAALVGFSSRNGFTRAFRDHHGITPRDYAALAVGTSGALSERVSATRGSGTLTHLIGRPAGLPAEPDDGSPLPASQTAPHTNDIHVLTWIYRGEGYLRIGETSYPRRRGDVIWIPAGVEHQAGVLEDSIALPVGDLLPGDAQITEPLRMHLPPSWDTYLLHRSISTRTGLRPEDFDHRSILDMFREQFTVHRARTVPIPTDARARDAATAFLRQMRALPDTELDPAIHEAFWRETGMTFATWRNAARMRTARDLLAEGGKPSAVARRVGYTQVSNFSRAFTRFHGVSPSKYQRPAPGHGMRSGRACA